MNRWVLSLLIVAFALTRLAMIHYADNPDSYPFAGAPFTADVDNVFHDAAHRITELGEEPYSEFDFPYPPGVIPFVVAPEHSWPDLGGYRSGFIRLMALVDALGLVGVVVLARRWGSMVGPWLWVILFALLGPLVYVRLDLIPAVATVWALERASAGRWPGAGGWLGFGAIAKVYPAFLLPLAWSASPPRARRRLLVAFVATIAATVFAVLAFVGGSPVEVFRDSLSTHAGRGLHIESTWGSLLLIADRFGLSSPIESTLSTLHFSGGIARVLAPLALVLSVGAVVLGTLATPPDDDGFGLGSASFATLGLLLGVGTVFSPQFVIWLTALGSITMCVRRPGIRFAVWLLVPIVVMTQFLYPYQYHRILARDGWGLGVLAGRNLLVLLAGILALAAILRQQGPTNRVARLLTQARTAVTTRSGSPATRRPH